MLNLKENPMGDLWFTNWGDLWWTSYLGLLMKEGQIKREKVGRNAMHIAQNNRSRTDE